MSGSTAPFVFLVDPFTWLVTGFTVAYLLLKWLTWDMDFFTRQGIPGPKPLPFIGNWWGVWKRNVVTYDSELLQQYGKTVGTFEGTTPNLVTIDTDLIRAVFVDDFDHFVTRRNFRVTHKYMRKMINVMRHKEWLDVRGRLSTTFAAAKTKKMTPKIIASSEDLARKLLELGQSEIGVDTKKICNGFTMDVIAKCAFGTDVDDVDDDSDEFVENAWGASQSKVNKSPWILLALTTGGLLLKVLGDKIFVSKQFTYLFDLVARKLDERKRLSKAYNDFLETTREALNKPNKKGSSYSPEEIDEIVIGQTLLFLIIGFDTTTTTLSSACFELARNARVQEELHRRVRDQIERHGGIGRETVADCAYLDHFVREVLRLHPPATRLKRQCRRDVVCKGIHIKEGMLVTVPSYPLHHSAENYHRPDEFDPDRWAPENKSELNPYAYAAFGFGPRNCIAAAFAMEQLKIALCVVVSRMRFVPVKETPEKLQYEDGFVGIPHPLSVVVGVVQR